MARYGTNKGAPTTRQQGAHTAQHRARVEQQFRTGVLRPPQAKSPRYHLGPDMNWGHSHGQMAPLVFCTGGDRDIDPDPVKVEKN